MNALARSWPLAALLSAACGVASAAPFPGPFAINDGITFYLVNDNGAPFKLSLKVTVPWRDQMPQPILVRVLDPQEKPLVRHEFPGDRSAQPQPDQLDLDIPASNRGIYQVVVHGSYSASWRRTDVELKTVPEMEFGVFGHLQWLIGMKDQFADAYVYLPPGLTRLRVEASEQLDKLDLIDGAGSTQLSLNKDKLQGEVALPQGEHVWRLQASGEYYKLDFNSLPIILCPSEKSARAIHASVDVMPDGSVCFHKHQVAAWKLLQQYKRRPVSDYAVTVEPLEQFDKQFMVEPNRNQLLFGHYGVVSSLPAILADQNLDAKSPWFGSIWYWKDADGKPKPGNPLADYDRAGLEAFGPTDKDLAALYWLKAGFNPYYHNPRLLNRIIIAALLDQMILREGEYVATDNTYYYGIHAFALTHSHSGAFSLVYKDTPPEVQRVWQAGQQRLTDRLLYGQVGGCTNQWTVLLAGLWRYYEGTGDDEYKRAVLRNTHWLTDAVFGGTGQRPAGYMTEAMGPDATYNGITGHYLAELYHATGDKAILEAERKSYDLFNHTVAPEPDGTWLGSSGYCHRTPGDWTSPQYGAGLGPMSDELPEAGLRYPEHPPWAYPVPITDEASRTKAEADLRKAMQYFGEDYFTLEPANAARANGAFDIQFTNWRNWTNRFLPGELPCVAEASFTRNFGDEFLCVRRPSYYAFLYCGVAYQEWQMGVRPKEYLEQYPHNDGLCMFWSPEFGSSLLTKNWGASRANTLLVKVGEGQVLWPYYMNVKSKLDTVAATAELSGKIRETPLTYQRSYRFLDDGVECTLSVKSDGDFRCENVWECIPYPLADLKPGMQVSLLDAQGQPVENGQPAKAIRFGDKAGYGHSITFAEPVVIELGQDESTDHYAGKHTYGRALVSLPAQWTAGQEYALQYRLVPK